LALLAATYRGGLLVKKVDHRFMSVSELEAFWEPVWVDHGEGGVSREERYRRALEGILACSSHERTVWLLQSVAARALGYDDLAARLLEKVEGKP
jgi:hypothetical protein